MRTITSTDRCEDKPKKVFLSRVASSHRFKQPAVPATNKDITFLIPTTVSASAERLRPETVNHNNWTIPKRRPQPAQKKKLMQSNRSVEQLQPLNPTNFKTEFEERSE
jgi:hypothetical protein